MLEGFAQQLHDEAPKALFAALIPAIQMLWKWFKNRDSQAKRDALRKKIADLASQKESLAKVGQLPHGEQLLSDLEAELETSIAELTALRAPKAARKPADRSWPERWFLLFVPSGATAWIVHTLFFINLAVVGMGIIGLCVDWGDDGMYGVLGLAIFLIPAFILRAIAIKIADAHSVHEVVA